MNNLCDLFNEISKKVWVDIHECLDVLTSPAEIGVTSNLIIKEIRKFMLANKTDLIWIDKAKNENTFGGDLDLYIQLPNGEYIRLLLQAKILNTSACFDKVFYKTKKTGKYQFEMLNKVEETKLAKTYYLFYSGGDSVNKSGSDCSGFYDKDQLGLSLVETEKIEHLFNMGVKNIGFAEISKYAIPWRALTCCDEMEKLQKTFKTYSLAQLNLDTRYEKRFFKKEPAQIGFITDEERKSKEIRKLNKKMHEENIEGNTRIVINKYYSGGGTTIYRLS